MASNLPWQVFLDQLLRSLLKEDGLSAFKIQKTDSERCTYCLAHPLISSSLDTWLNNNFQNSNREYKKDSCKMKSLKQQGNQEFVKKNDEKALNHYNSALLFASDSESALLYANRSAVFFSQSQWQKCVTDIEVALSTSLYPEHLLWKLYKRKGEALRNLKNYKECFKCFEKALELNAKSTNEELKIQLNKLIEQVKGLAMSDIDKFSDQITADFNGDKSKTRLNAANDNVLSNEDTLNHTSNKFDKNKTVTPFQGWSNVIRHGSSCLNIEYTEEKGRHIVANRDIPAGSLIISEKPFAAVLLSPWHQTHCSHCFLKVMTQFYACYQCSQVRYCSEECRKASWELYHYFECGKLGLLEKIGIARLALRMFLVTTSNDMKTSGLVGNNDESDRERNPQTLMYHTNKSKTGDENRMKNDSNNKFSVNNEKDGNHVSQLLHSSTHPKTEDNIINGSNNNEEDILNGIRGCDRNGVYCGDFNSVFYLLPHSDKMQTEDLFQYSVAGVLLLKLLTKYKPNDENGNYRPAEEMTKHRPDKMLPMNVIGGLLIRHIQQLVCNAHAITSLNETETNKQNHSSQIIEQDQVRIATAIYPTTSLLNHSCEASILNCFLRDRLLVRTVREIREGEEIYNCYGPHHRRMDFQTRQLSLKQQYFFTCACIHCSQGAVSDQELNGFCCWNCKECLSTQDEICNKCSEKQIDWLKYCSEKHASSLSLFEEGLKQLKDQNKNIKKAFGLFLRCAEMQERVLFKFHKDLARTFDAIAKCHSLLGEYDKCLLYLKKSLKTTEMHYGKDSVETTNELLKMSDVYMAIMQMCIDSRVAREKIDEYLPEAFEVVERTTRLVEQNKEPGSEDLLLMKERYESIVKLKFFYIAQNQK